jgi:hypothetical protein
VLYLKSESSSEEKGGPSTAKKLDNESQQVPSTEQIKEPEPEPNPKPREETKSEMSDSGTPVAERKCKPKWPTLHMYVGEGEWRDPQSMNRWF